MAAASVSPHYTSAQVVDPHAALRSFRGHEVVAYGRQSRLEVATSSSHSDYRAHHVAPAAPVPQLPPRQPVPFEGASVYKVREAGVRVEKLLVWLVCTSI
jgi:hypothetical protein